MEAAIFLRADKLCDINGNGDNKVKADMHIKKNVGTDTRGALNGMNKKNGEGSGHKIA